MSIDMSPSKARPWLVVEVKKEHRLGSKHENSYHITLAEFVVS